VAWTRAALALGAVGVLALLAVSGGSGADPRTPPALPGLPAPFLGAAVAGAGELTAAVDAYGDVVDLRPRPAGPALVENPAARQAAGTVDPATGIVPRIAIGGGPPLPLWRADSVRQRYLPGTNVVRSVARFGAVEATVTVAAAGRRLAVVVASEDGGVDPSALVNVEEGVRCLRAGQPGQLDLLCRVGRAAPVAPSAAAGPTLRETVRLIQSSAVADRRWLSRARPLGADAPTWAKAMYERSLLTLRALTDRRNGAVAAGARDGWAYVWPRDAATVAIALAAVGYRGEAERVTHFLFGLDLGGAARFRGDGSPVPGRAAQGDAVGWTAAAAKASGTIASARHAAPILSPARPVPWRDLADYQEGEPGDYLGNAIAAGASDILGATAPNNSEAFATPAGLVRRAGDPGSGLDSAAAWAVRPFPTPALYPAARRTLLRLATDGARFGITPGTGWQGGDDPWMAPTAWSAWSLAALGERRQALALLGDLRRAATPAGALPERVDIRTGVPSSTTPLAWPHAFAILALRQLWP
jgi:glucoamylase